MRIALFYHSAVSDWNHGNAHFLRGVANELTIRDHEVLLYEPRDAWSRQNLLREEQGESAVERFAARYPLLEPRYYDDRIDLGRELEGVDLVIVHEWNSHDLVRRIGAHRERAGFRLLFHDTHHRAVTAPESMAAYDLSRYDGVLAFGEAVKSIYLDNGWAQRAWTWHEAADTRLFKPLPGRPCEGDLIWVGNWGDDERTAELDEFLLEPVRRLGLRAQVYGVRYPEEAQKRLELAGIDYRGWVANFDVPELFARHRMTVHIPRRPYTRALPGIPTIRPFEALACGIPLVSAPWDDTEHLFRPGIDYLVARNGSEMVDHLRTLQSDPDFAARLAANGRETILARHTCSHRVDELLGIYREIAPSQHNLVTTGIFAT